MAHAPLGLGGAHAQCDVVGEQARADLELGRGPSAFHLETRAPPPFMSFRTSSIVAMLVSPGVVMARAPCAAPQSTAHCGPLAFKKP